MLERVLEPEVMDSPEEARDYDAMDHATVNRVFVTDLLTVWNGEGEFLDVGTGTAQIPIELCSRVPSAHGIAIDLAEEMLVVGRQNVQRAGLQRRIELQYCDAKRMPFADGHFAAVVSNSIVHHIPEPVAVFGQMVRVAAVGGQLFVRDLSRPADKQTLEHLVKTYAGDANAHQQQMFAESLHAALTLEEVREIVSKLRFDPEGVQQTSDRHWTWSARKH